MSNQNTHIRFSENPTQSTKLDTLKAWAIPVIAAIFLVVVVIMGFFVFAAPNQGELLEEFGGRTDDVIEFLPSEEKMEYLRYTKSTLDDNKITVRERSKVRGLYATAKEVDSNRRIKDMQASLIKKIDENSP